MRDDLAAYLADCAPRYSAERRMLGIEWNGPGYHTRVPNGTWVHPTRESLDYALGLLQSGAPADAERAAAIVGAVLALQDVDPTSRTYGIWPWLAEELLDQMNPPDWNWSDFCGARLAVMLAQHASLLPPDLIAAMRASLGHAAHATFRRNVGPTYTNIAIMGAGVTLAAGELLSEPWLVAYGRRRLERFLEHTAHHGGLNEYNSPTYTVVALRECERILHVVSDPAGRAAAEAIRRAAWETVAEHFHPPTGQWAGPHSRAYADRLDPVTVAYLAEQTGAPIRPHPRARVLHGEPALFPSLPCPPDLAARFRELPAPEVELRRRFIRRDDEESSTWGTTWMDETACLGSVNCDSLWIQRRPLLGYWRTPDDPAVVLRLRFLHDGQDFASAALRTSQRGPRALAALGLWSNRGDFHPYFDHPADGVFRAEDFRLRLELRGAGAAGHDLGGGQFALAAGDRRAVVHALPGRFGPHALTWQLGASDEGAFLDGICHHSDGPEAFDVARLEVIAALGIELLPAREPPLPAPRLAETPGALALEWPEAGLSLAAPTQAREAPH